MRHCIRAELSAKRVTPVHAKVYLQILVEKPNHRGDAINVLDSVADGVKDALGIDDRWFSLRGLDWTVTKAPPTVRIVVGQKETVDHQVCSLCGSIKPLDAFTRNRSMRSGRSRDCATCCVALDAARKRQV